MTKRLMISLFVLLLSLSSWAQGIGNADEFVAFAQAVTKGEPTTCWRNDDGEVCLLADIDMAKVRKFRGIPEFKGVFNGNGFSIKNLKCTEPIFGRIEGGTVRNLTIDASCSMKLTDGDNLYGFIAGVNAGLIEDCVNYGKIEFKSTFVSKRLLIGAIAGSNLHLVIKCKNYGPISADCLSRTDSEKPAVSIGGIVGRNGGSKWASCVAWSENLGKVTYVGDMMYDSVGGIVGDGNAGTVKFCVNRGEITSNASGINGWDIYSRCAGIVGYAKGDVLCCDNFGYISSQGNGLPSTAGVVGAMNDADVIIDCVNYGQVKVFNEREGSMGGVCATVSRSARVKSCLNYGDIIYEGVSTIRRTSVGGVVGYLYNTKDAVTGGYIRDCANYGTVKSGKGGNRYENDDKAIHTGGIAGYVRGSTAYRVILSNCSNFGKVESEGGRRGNIAGACPNVTVGGAYVSPFAEAAEPMEAGHNVMGCVRSDDGTPIAGVMVSDGFQTVLTDADGCYAMKSDMTQIRFVYISVPAACQIPVSGSSPQFYKRVPRYQRAVKADFVLSPRAQINDRYTLLMVADPQIRPYAVDGSAETWRDNVAPDMNAYRASLTQECYTINLGDLIYNYPVAYDDYLDVAGGLNCPVFNVIGNHDFDQRNLYSTSLGTPYFNVYTGPENYSFNIGKMHFIVLNDIIYDRTSAKDKYKVGLEDATLEWLRQDLQFIPKETTIVIAVHGQLFMSPKGSGADSPNFAKYSALLKDYAKVYCWAGHYHNNFGYDYAGKGLGMDNIEVICVSRATGSLRVNRYLNNHGVPQGYMVAEVDGSHMTWCYKAVGETTDEQMTVYDPSAVDGKSVAVNVWNWNEDTWGVPQWWENGQKVADMERWNGKDPAYVKLISDITDKYTLELAQPAASKYLFKANPTAGVSSGEVRVQDRFGNVHIKSIKW